MQVKDELLPNMCKLDIKALCKYHKQAECVYRVAGNGGNGCKYRNEWMCCSAVAIVNAMTLALKDLKRESAEK